MSHARRKFQNTAWATNILLTRVIDVGSSRENESRPHLQTKGEIGAYTALSHHWGSTECQLRTESSTFESFQDEISMELMLKTFCDAITVTC